ncbi:MAG: GTP cyclohydrolase I FolE [Clostridia bacterium]
MKYELTWDDVVDRVEEILTSLLVGFPEICPEEAISVYPVPRGGIFAALVMQRVALDHGYTIEIVSSPKDSFFLIDDIIDSGKTQKQYKQITDRPFYALVDKNKEDQSGWYVFPWEQISSERGPEENITRIIQYIGDDPQREGLQETPSRVVKSYSHLYSGYDADVNQIIKVFEDDSCKEMVVLKDIEFYSTCEHHMLPFFGKAHIAYIPDGRVMGVSKLARLLEVYSRRLQIQERICQQVTSALDAHLKPLGSACVLHAQHFCMTSRGVQKQNSIMVTSSLTGSFLEPAVRNEFLNFIRS